MKQILFPKNWVENAICWFMYGLHIWHRPEAGRGEYTEKGVQCTSWEVDTEDEDVFGDSIVILPEERSR